MSLVSQTLKAAWNKFSGICDKVYKRPGILDIRNIEFETYMVTCPDTAKKIREWAQEKTHAEKAIDNYLSREFSTKVLGISGPAYKLDDAGHVKEVRLRDWMTFTHPGWEARDINSNFLVPIRKKTGLTDEEIESGKLRPHSKEDKEDKKENKVNRYLKEQTLLGELKRQELQALPAVPPYQTLKELINWPDMQPQPWEEEASDNKFIEYAHASDRLLTPFGFGDHVFIEIPKATSFDAYPVIQEKIKGWDKPEFLTSVTNKDIAALESEFKQNRIREQQKHRLDL